MSYLYIYLINQIEKKYSGHNADVHTILPFAYHLISIDTDNVMNVWEIDTCGELTFCYFLIEK